MIRLWETACRGIGEPEPSDALEDSQCSADTDQNVPDKADLESNQVIESQVLAMRQANAPAAKQSHLPGPCFRPERESNLLQPTRAGNRSAHSNDLMPPPVCALGHDSDPGSDSGAHDVCLAIRAQDRLHSILPSSPWPGMNSSWGVRHCRPGLVEATPMSAEPKTFSSPSPPRMDCPGPGTGCLVQGRRHDNLV